MPMLITDPNQRDNPIVFVNDAFLSLTGYDREDIIGKNCRFLQGSETSSESVDNIRSSIAANRDVAVEILNYRKDGSTFWNALFISPVIDEGGKLLYFFASQLDVTDKKQAEIELNSQRDRFEIAVKERTRELETALHTQTMLLHEVDHRVKNNLQLVNSLVSMQLRSISDATVRASLQSLRERIEALSTVHSLLYQRDDIRQLSVADLVRDLTNSLVASSGRQTIETNLELDDVVVPAEQATPIALIVNELVTNVLKHAFPDDRSGRLDVRVKNNGEGLVVEVADNGVGLPKERRESAFGTKLTDAVARQLQSRIEWTTGSDGTTATLRVKEVT